MRATAFLYPLLADDDGAARLIKCCVPAGLAAVQAVMGAPGLVATPGVSAAPG
ncbi:hypothetical protein HMPREF1978_01937 [Actinomyces graevenitzii F0530]|uniref:Uncharacterized protein n=1 Tax=Actinomyces graevenitzii F0530 TaxID=1321817 RepID=U1R6M0_9ACTO|nr:hypothetical protein HMPREF1978_01937 [Actinomyces graevenitzii F0530]